MSIKNIGRNKWRVVIKGKLDHKTGKYRYIDRIISGSKQDAEEFEAKAKGVRIAPSKLSVGQYLNDKWYPSLEVEGNTREYYRRGIVSLEPLYCFPLSDLAAYQIEQAFFDMQTGSTRRRAKKTLSAALNAAVRWSMIPFSPLGRTQITIGDGNTRDYESYTADELSSVLDAFRGHPGEAVVIVMSFCGLRREEALALDWDDIDLKQGSIVVKKAWTNIVEVPDMKKTKTTCSVRVVYIAGQGLERLSELASDGPLWPGKVRDIIRPDVASKSYKRRIEARGLRYIPLSNLRHTNATIMLASGIDVSLVSRNLGHARVSTTVNAYLKPMEDLRKGTADTFADAVKIGV